MDCRSIVLYWDYVFGAFTILIDDFREINYKERIVYHE